MTDKEIDYMFLQKENENLLKANKDLVREIEKIQSYLTDKVAESEQAVKEFAEKLKEKALSHCRIINCYELTFIETTIDELLEEYEK